MQEKASFGALLKRYRLAAGLSQEALAARASLSTRAISDLERGINRTPRYDTLELLVNALSLSPQQRDVLRAAAHPEMAPAPEEIPAPVFSGLPLASTRFIGREAELAQIEDYLDAPDCRLLTLIGPGGVGKTRLAYQAAASKAGDFASGVCAVPLSGLASSQYLVSTLAERLMLQLYGSADQKAQVLDYLREKRLLLVMDNCEHILDGIEVLDEILAAAPSVKILATSRERLNLQGEWLFPVQGLPFPQNESEAGVETYSAIQLFVQSARRGGPGFRLDDITSVARICKLVEGLPLAIELAASWVHQMPCERIASHIQHDLDFLSTNLRNVPERHRSTRALFEHSWRLLSGDEQAVLRKLSVFRGGFDADAAAHIAGSSLRMLSRLSEKSLVRASSSGRYDLHELLRQFAEEKLREADEFATTRDKHLDYFVIWAERANVGLRGGEQVKWFGHIETEHDNLFSGQCKRASAPVMDKILHAERLDGKAKRLHRRAIDDLPVGAMIALDGAAFAVKGNRLLRWTPQGYADIKPRPRGIEVDVLTPPSMLAVLARGYLPGWHKSAD